MNRKVRMRTLPKRKEKNVEAEFIKELTEDLIMTKKIKITDWNQLPVSMTLEDIMAALQIGRDLALRLVHSAGFPALKLGRQYIVNRDKFVAWFSTRQGDLKI